MSFTGQVYSTGAPIGVGFLQDGQFVDNFTAQNPLIQKTDRTIQDVSFSYLIDKPAPGTHSYCLSDCQLGGSTTAYVVLKNSPFFSRNQFYIKEIK